MDAGLAGLPGSWRAGDPPVSRHPSLLRGNRLSVRWNVTQNRLKFTQNSRWLFSPGRRLRKLEFTASEEEKNPVNGPVDRKECRFIPKLE